MAAVPRIMRPKRKTKPLDDDTRSRLLNLNGYVSSGSEHDAVNLAGVVNGIFFSDDEEDNAIREREGGKNNPCEEFAPPVAVSAAVRGMVREAAVDAFAIALATAVEKLSRPGPPRVLMGRLRELGYDAGLCKARWEARAGAGAGSYEYVDVLREDTSQRYLVEVDFRGQFEIARATAEYGRVTEELPRVLVARPEQLRPLLRLLADAGRRSLHARGLQVAPWRRIQYMQAKWLGPYRRTTNTVSAAVAAPVVRVSAQPALIFGAGHDVKCRLVGFDMMSRLSALPALASVK